MKRRLVSLFCTLFAISAHGNESASLPDPTGTIGTVVRVKTARAAAIPVGEAKALTAIVTAFRSATVAAEVGGRIVERLVEPGMLAKAGDALVHIDDARARLAVQQARAQARAARVDLDHAAYEHRRGRRLFQKSVISQDTLDDLRFQEERARAQLQAAQVQVGTAQRNLDDTKVTCPFTGQIETVIVQVGDYVNPGQPVATLTDFSQARLIAGVTGREASNVVVGSAATAMLEDLGGINVPAIVTSVGRVRDRVSGTYPVELRITDAAASRLREGMVATVSWQLGSDRGDQLTIPASSLIRRAGKLYVYVVEAGRARLTPVTVGRSDGKRVEVVAGVTLGQLVVTEGQFALRDGAEVVTGMSG